MKLEAIWQMEGTLTTRTPMHVGDGRTRPLGGEEDVEVQTAAKTPDKRARIPGSSLKGVLRSGFGEREALDIFGEKEQGGVAQFLDAYSAVPLAWNDLVLGRTAIDGVTGAAQQHLLFQMEVVPPGIVFSVRIRGKAFAGERWQDTVGVIERGMRRFNDDTIRLGAGEANQRGLCTWNLAAVKVMDAAERREWLKNPVPLEGYLGGLGDCKGELEAQTAAAPTPRGRTLKLTLKFDGHPFLVNDPRKTGKKVDGKHAHAARRMANGRLLLPAESFRGVLAHQAARIARTNGPQGKSGDRENVKRSSGGGLPQDKNAVTRLFGAAGWASVLEVGDFVEIGRKEQPCPGDPKVQQFLAVDRFTGGGVDERKFDAEGGWEPLLHGEVTVDLERLRAIGKVEPALGLLALTLRDLAEGDLAFGWGSGKGYGWATVDTGVQTAVEWVEKAMSGWGAGTVKDWIGAWQAEGGNRG